MYVGVILDAISAHEYPSSVPHVCGGDPKDPEVQVDFFTCSPCMWGVILRLNMHPLNNNGVPHVCGG